MTNAAMMFNNAGALRLLTGAPMCFCVRALEKCDQRFDSAFVYLHMRYRLAPKMHQVNREKVEWSDEMYVNYALRHPNFDSTKNKIHINCPLCGYHNWDEDDVCIYCGQKMRFIEDKEDGLIRLY